MKVLKFGGTSVGSPERMSQVAEIISDNTPKIVVLSAVSGTTNKLVEISNLLLDNKQNEALAKIDALRTRYDQFIYDLFENSNFLQKAQHKLSSFFGQIHELVQDQFSEVQEKFILAQGELISTNLFQLYLEEKNIRSVLLPALDFMRTDKNGEPRIDYLKENLEIRIKANNKYSLFITQGYICRNHEGYVDNLNRGGSDYTATLIGAAINAEEIQIWTDIDGMHNNDPRIVEQTHPVRQLSYREAAELAYFGAKILHPTCVIPAEKTNVPIRLKNTMNVDAKGTLISKNSSGKNITAIAAKDNIIAIKIRSGRMLNAYGFLRKVFEVFENYKTPIDMITTSEVAVSLTIDDPTNLNSIVQALQEFGEVDYDLNQSIVCIVGDYLTEKKGYAKSIFSSLENIPIRMVSFGGSENNVSILINTADKNIALNALNEGLFLNRLKKTEVR